LDSATLVVVGTGFASTFFLHRYLALASKGVRVVVLERGALIPHHEQLANRRPTYLTAPEYYETDHPEKEWLFSVAMGGGSNCWWGNTPRLHPSDFETATRYGVGMDWPVSYDDMESYYCDAEELMSISGDSESRIMPRSRPYPVGPHRFSRPAKLLAEAYPEQFVMTPCARPPAHGGVNRAACCNNGVCDLCPINSKFTIINAFMSVYEDPRVTVIRPAEVTRFGIKGGVVQQVIYRAGGVEQAIRADHVALGANAVFNPLILMNSGLNDDVVGRYLHEQVGVPAVAFLDGLRGFGGSSSLTGYLYTTYDGPHRKERAGSLIEFYNMLEPPLVRLDLKRGLDVLHLKVVYEDLPQQENRVRPKTEGSTTPFVEYQGHSPYVDASIAKIVDDLAPVTSALPVEDLRILKPQISEAHIQGTTRMGADPTTSVVDAFQRHHRCRNLQVLGSSVFPSCSPANPTLTIAAMSLRAAEALYV
jgi:choline dehydrogenase-like flavoprotein